MKLSEFKEIIKKVDNIDADEIDVVILNKRNDSTTTVVKIDSYKISTDIFGKTRIILFHEKVI